MRSASYQSAPDQPREPLRRNAAALLLALAVHLLGIILFLVLTPPWSPRLEPEQKIFKMLPLSDPGIAKKPTPRGSSAKRASSGGSPKHAAPVKPPPVTVTPVPQPVPPLNMIILSKETFAASDISKLPSHRGDGGDGNSSGKDSGPSYGPGEGPGGERLYNAQWYVEPTHAELATYLPPGGAKPGWGMIACQTIENYHVENCRQLGESPPGSGLSRALRLAAWQFRVRPPRIGGRPMIGAWVRIRFDFTVNGEK